MAMKKTNAEQLDLFGALRLNGQGKLLNNAGNPLREGNEEFHETVREPSSVDMAAIDRRKDGFEK